MIYEYSNSTCIGFEKSKPGVLMTSRENADGPQGDAEDFENEKFNIMTL